MKQQVGGWVLVLFCSSTALAQTGSIGGTIRTAAGAGAPADVLEYVCSENNSDPKHMTGK